MLKFPFVTFVIPIFNSEEILEDALKSIKRQDYPKDKIEIITPDGGSEDSSKKIASSYGCRVITNKKRLAEPGFMLGAKKARGELVIYMGADNRLFGDDWIRKMIKPFEDRDIIGAYPWLRNHQKNTWLTKYFNTFTDPVNHFILGYSCNPLYFGRAYRILKKTKNYVIYDFKLNKFPLIAFDQGFVSRKSYDRPEETEYDDILPVLNLIKNKRHTAFVPKASNYHFTLEKGISQYAKKMRWIIDNNISPEATFGLPTRVRHMNLGRKIRFYFWPIYAMSIVGPLFYSLIGFVRDKKKEWIYHTPITIITGALVAYEILRIKVFRGKSLVSRQ